MTPVRMTHPKHGFMHAYSTAEIRDLEALGWKPEVANMARPPMEALNRFVDEVKAEPAQKRKYTKRQAA